VSYHQHLACSERELTKLKDALNILQQVNEQYKQELVDKTRRIGKIQAENQDLTTQLERN